MLIYTAVFLLSLIYSIFIAYSMIIGPVFASQQERRLPSTYEWNKQTKKKSSVTTAWLPDFNKLEEKFITDFHLLMHSPFNIVVVLYAPDRIFKMFQMFNHGHCNIYICSTQMTRIVIELDFLFGNRQTMCSLCMYNSSSLNIFPLYLMDDRPSSQTGSSSIFPKDNFYLS